MPKYKKVSITKTGVNNGTSSLDDSGMRSTQSIKGRPL